jgi:uncharacterized OB-fold protein
MSYSAALYFCSSRSILNAENMDDLSRALSEVLLGEINCPVCMEFMVPPSKLCTNGHNICSRCTVLSYMHSPVFRDQ